MGNSVNMKKFNELQKKIKDWSNKTSKNREQDEIQLKQVNGAIELIKNKYSSILKKEKYTALHSMISEGERESSRLERNIKDYNKQLNCSHDDILEDNYVGHDSHKDYYETSCKKCRAVFDDYSY